jgi:lipopolysaccharide export system permease protein
MLIYNYIIKKCLFNTLFVLLAFIFIFAIFTLLGDASSIGTGDFNLGAMVYYLIILTPTFCYMLLPLAILIGVMLGMLSLVNYSEYAIIRTSGVSLKKILLLLVIFGSCFSIINFILGEFIAPNANHYAKIYKMEKSHQKFSTNLNSGIWSKDGNNTFVNIKQILPDLSINDIYSYYYDNNSNLTKTLYAKSGKFSNQTKLWSLSDVVIKNYTSFGLNTQKINSYDWRTSIDPSYFSVLVITPEEMSALELIKYISHLATNHQSTQRYNIAFWAKLLYPITCLSMAILSIAFIPNNRRNINLGAKLFFGIIIGISFFFITKLVNYLAVLFSWNAILSAVTPNLLLLIATYYFVKKQN